MNSGYSRGLIPCPVSFRQIAVARDACTREMHVSGTDCRLSDLMSSVVDVSTCTYRMADPNRSLVSFTVVRAMARELAVYVSPFRTRRHRRFGNRRRARMDAHCR